MGRCLPEIEKVTMKSIKELEDEIVREFEEFPDIDSKYAYIFHLGGELPELDPSLKDETHQVKGCQSSLWFHLRTTNNGLRLEADSDSLVIKGIAALFVRLIEGRQVEEIPCLSLDFIDRINVWKLASERNNGLVAMLNHIKAQASQMSSDRIIL